MYIYILIFIYSIDSNVFILPLLTHQTIVLPYSSLTVPTTTFYCFQHTFWCCNSVNWDDFCDFLFSHSFKFLISYLLVYKFTYIFQQKNLQYFPLPNTANQNLQVVQPRINMCCSFANSHCPSPFCAGQDQMLVNQMKIKNASSNVKRNARCQ